MLARLSLALGQNVGPLQQLGVGDIEGSFDVALRAAPGGEVDVVDGRRQEDIEHQGDLVALLASLGQPLCGDAVLLPGDLVLPDDAKKGVVDVGEDCLHAGIGGRLGSGHGHSGLLSHGNDAILRRRASPAHRGQPTLSAFVPPYSGDGGRS